MYQLYKSIDKKFEYNTQKLNTLFKNNNLKGGGEVINGFTIQLLIGLILIIISIIFFLGHNQYIEIKPEIKKVDKNEITIEYKVNEIEYVKKIKNENKEDILIYYNKYNPNIIRNYNINYKFLAMIIFLIGIILINLK